MKYCCFALIALALTGPFMGCSGTRIEPDNLRLTVSLRTAISARHAQWLEQNVAAIEARRASGQMSDQEFQAFQAIIAKAQAGDWETAEQDVIRLQKAQRPTREQVSRLPKIAP